MTQVKEARRLALVEAIRTSGLNIDDFAAQYLARDRATVYRWLSGKSPVPKVVANWLLNHAHKIMGEE